MKSLTQNLSGTTQSRGYSTAQGTTSFNKYSPTVSVTAISQKISHRRRLKKPGSKSDVFVLTFGTFY